MTNPILGKRILTSLLFVLLLLVVAGVSAQQTAAQPTPSGSPNAAKVARPAGSTANPAAKPDAPVAFVLDDGTAEQAIGFGSNSSNQSVGGIWLNRYIPGSARLPITLNTIQILFPGTDAGNFVGRTVRLLVYVDTDANGNPNNATLVYQSSQVITVADWNTFQVFPVNAVINTPGDIYIGWEDQWAETCPTPFDYVAAQDTTATQRRSWFAGQRSSCTPNYNNLGANTYLGLTDTLFGYPGNWMIRATGNSYEPFSPTPTATSTPTATPTPRCPGERFTDVCPGDYFYTPVIYLNDHGAISGYADGSFRPYNDTTRGQLSKIIVLAENWTLDTTGGPHFTDVPTSNPFYAYIETAYNHGIISGYGDNSFRPGNNVTRGQTAKIVVLAQGWTLYTPPTPTFSDVPPTNAFYAYVETAYQHAIISGYADGTFRPYNNVTRGQLSKIVYNAVTEATPTPTSTVSYTPTTTATAVTTATETPSATSTETATPSTTATATTLAVPRR